MNTDRKHFLFNLEWADILAELPKEVKYEVYDAIVEYARSGKLPDLKPIAKGVMLCIKREIDSQKSLFPPSGESHWNWKGGVTDENHRQRESYEYRQWRKSVFERDNYTCQVCGASGGELNAHHIKPFSVYPDLRFDVSNGLTLCKQCHINVHKTEREWLN